MFVHLMHDKIIDSVHSDIEVTLSHNHTSIMYILIYICILSAFNSFLSVSFYFMKLLKTISNQSIKSDVDYFHSYFCFQVV